jgi:hypothetical protein
MVHRAFQKRRNFTTIPCRKSAAAKILLHNFVLDREEKMEPWKRKTMRKGAKHSICRQKNSKKLSNNAQFKGANIGSNEQA